MMIQTYKNDDSEYRSQVVLKRFWCTSNNPDATKVYSAEKKQKVW